MRFRLVAVFVLGAACPAIADPGISLPPRPGNAPAGREVVARIASLDAAAREAVIVAEVKLGNVPDFWRRFVEVKLGDASFLVAPDYLAIGSDHDYFLAPLSPAAAQAIADHTGCVLPTRKMVDAIYHAAPVKLPPLPIPPSAAMTSVAVFAEHNARVGEQRRAVGTEHPAGALVAGHKKDVVLSPLLATKPDKVAIYGWHRPDGSAIQPLYLGHAATWVDYSHGIRLVRREITLRGAATTVDAVLADPALCAVLSDEGPMASARYGDRPVAATALLAARKKYEELRFEPGVRAVLDVPEEMEAGIPVRLILYALPAGNTIEQTIGRRVQPGDDWHFDIQHIGAQTRWLRARVHDANLIVVYLQSDEKSFVLWRRKYPDHAARIVSIVDALRRRFAASKIVLTGHSAGGSFTFGFLDGLERVPADIERIAFLDSDYAYDVAKAHDAKLGQWLADSPAHRLCVIAYQDHVALLNGKTFVSEQGGTWGRSHAMLRELGAVFTFARTDEAGLQRHTALQGRVEFLLKENPEKAVLHTRQVELNGFIHAMLSGTELAGQGYTYLGARAYADLIRVE
ncbi:MAG: hypothetical protein EXS37_20040 [Opitutus sp.]|nr:hypothetical protein [Opitutus sp.]